MAAPPTHPTDAGIREMIRVALGERASRNPDAHTLAAAIRHYPGYRALLEEAPRLAPPYASAAFEGMLGQAREPAQALRNALLRQGIGKAGWRFLLVSEESPFEAVQAGQDDVPPFLVHVWVIAACLRANRQLMPEVADRIAMAFEWWPCDERPYAFELSQGFWPALLRAVGRRQDALDCDAALDDFIALELDKVLAWLVARWPEIDPNQAHEGWRWLLRQATQWELEELAKAQARNRIQHWRVPLSQAEIDGVQAIAIPDSLELLEEGRAMHHCIDNYREDCLFGKVLVVSLRDRRMQRLATALLVPDLLGWRVVEVRTRFNREASPAIYEIAQRFAERASEADRRRREFEKRSEEERIDCNAR